MTDSMVELAYPGDRPDNVSTRDDTESRNKDDIKDAEQDKPKESEYGTEVGVPQHLPFSTPWIDDTYEIFREEEDTAPTVRQLVSMRRTDGQARALYRLITLPIRSALRSATYVMPEDGDEGGTEEAEFVDNLFSLPASAGGMEVPFQRVMAQILMAVFDGFAAFEMVYWAPEKGPLKGKITLQKLAHRPAETITFLTDEKGSFAGFRQRASVHGKTIDAKIDKEDAFYYAAQEEEKAYYGVSYFQSAFYHYDKKTKLYFIAHLAAQRAAVGTRNGTWPPNASEKDKTNFKRALADLGLAQYIAHPETFKVEILKEGGDFDFLQYINHHNSQMSKSILAAFFDESQGGEGAALVDFGTQSDALFMLMLQTIMDEIAAAINHFIIPKFIDWNFGSDKYPQFQWGKFTDEQKAAIRTTFDALAVAGQPNVTPEFLFELEKKIADEMGLEIDYDEIEKEMEEQKEMQKAADAASMGFGQEEPQLGPDGQPVGPEDPSDPMAGAFGPPGAPPQGGQPGAAPAAPVGPGNAMDPRQKKRPVAPVALTMMLDADEIARQLLLSAVENDEDADDDDLSDS